MLDERKIALLLYKNITLLKHFSKSITVNEKLVSEVAKYNGNIYNTPCTDRSIVLFNASIYGESLYHASAEFRDDREIVLTAVRNYGFALRYASDALRSDREIVLAAVQNRGGALTYANWKYGSGKTIDDAT